LDEDTAIVVRNNRFEVIGNSYVVIYDNTRQIDSGGPFYFLEPGDQYDFLERQAYRPSRSLEPLERIVETGQ
jgi:cyanophycinase